MLIPTGLRNALFLSVIVEGNPIPKQRARIVGRHGYTPKRTKAYEQKVAWAVKQEIKGKLFTGDIAVFLDFYRSDRRRCDIDNLQKAILDALNGIAYKDDSQIVKLHSEKHFDRENPRVYIKIENTPKGR